MMKTGDVMGVGWSLAVRNVRGRVRKEYCIPALSRGACN